MLKKAIPMWLLFSMKQFNSLHHPKFQLSFLRAATLTKIYCVILACVVETFWVFKQCIQHLKCIHSFFTPTTNMSEWVFIHCITHTTIQRTTVKLCYSKPLKGRHLVLTHICCETRHTPSNITPWRWLWHLSVCTKHFFSVADTSQYIVQGSYSPHLCLKLSQLNSASVIIDMIVQTGTG